MRLLRQGRATLELAAADPADAPELPSGRAPAAFPWQAVANAGAEPESAATPALRPGDCEDAARLAAVGCAAPMAAVALLQQGELHILASVGFVAAGAAGPESPFARAAAERSLFEVADATLDPRFSGSGPDPAGPGVRFWAGIPFLAEDGSVLGVLAVLDPAARALDPLQRELLRGVARQLETLSAARTESLGLRREKQKSEERLSEHTRLIEDILSDPSDSNASRGGGLVQHAAQIAEQARLLEMAGAAIVVRSLDGTVSFWNRGAEEMFGWPRTEVIGWPLQDILRTRFPEDHETLLALLLERERWEGELVHHRRDGGEVVVSSRWVLRRDTQGRPAGVLQIDEDITQRKQVENALREVTGLQRAILDSAAFSIISTDASGIIRTCNSAAERMFGYPAADLVGSATPALFHDPGEIQRRAQMLSADRVQAATAFECIAGTATLGQTEEREWTCLRRNGSRFPILLSVTALADAAGKAAGYLCVGQDISVRKEVDRLKSEFVSVVSHELRTPLTSIRGSLGLLEGGLLGPLEPMAAEFVGIARGNCDRLVRLINDILDLDKMEAGKLELRMQGLSPRELVEGTLSTLSGMATGAGVALQSEVADETQVLGDNDRLTQVITNLVSNAIKFSPEGAAVRVGAQMSKPGRLRFTVTDQGPGIAPDQLHKLFGKFQQLDSSDSRAKGGTGLGLAISKAIVEQHGGSIGVTSAVGQGTTFWFELGTTCGTAEVPPG